MVSSMTPNVGSVMIPARYVEFQIHQLVVLVVDDNAFMRKMVRSHVFPLTLELDLTRMQEICPIAG